MELISTVPYVRFVDHVSFVSQRGPSKTLDCRLLYTVQGTASMELSGNVHTMTHGSLAMFQSGTEYVIRPDPQVTMITVDFDFTQDFNQTTDLLLPCPAARFRPEDSHGQVRFSDAAALNDPVYLENASFLDSAFQELLLEFREKRLFYRGKNSTQFKNILYEILRALQTGTDHQGVVHQVLEYVEHNLQRPLTNREIGDALNYNPNYLNRLILQHTGMSLHQYLLQRRLSLAAVLIHNTQKPISEIAISLGFHSASHFSNFFKQATGTTPVQYRKNGTL